MFQKHSCKHDIWGAENSWVTSQSSDFQASNANGCSACAMLLKAVDEFMPDWTGEDCNAMRSICLSHTQFSVSVTLLEDQEEVGSFYLLRNSMGISPPFFTLEIQLTESLCRRAIYSYRGDEKQSSSSTFGHCRRLPFSEKLLIPQKGGCPSALKDTKDANPEIQHSYLAVFFTWIYPITPVKSSSTSLLNQCNTSVSVTAGAPMLTMFLRQPLRILNHIMKGFHSH
jgi:hypothetical protein